MKISINIMHDTATNTLTLNAVDDCGREIVLECLSEDDVNRISIRELKKLFDQSNTL